MSLAYFIASWACTLAVVTHAMRQPEAAWLSADRSRSGWLTYLIPAGFLGLGPLCVLVYWLGVVRHLPAADVVAGPAPQGDKGVATPRECAACQARLSPDDLFCGSCGSVAGARE